MKKIKVFLFAALILASVFMMAACAEKVPITAGDFKKKAGESGYEVFDVTAQYEDFPHVLLSVSFEKDDIYMQFFEIEDAESAVGMFNTNKATVISYKSGTSSTSELNLSNYNKYTQKSGAKYHVVERVGATFVYAECGKGNSKIIDDFLKDIGY
ncbi:MAG: hypothetical protein FWG34_06995 [Oscillospiraceae bacterium]|nr:hypothetical protein [Oscillospiraceae bacterium]